MCFDTISEHMFWYDIYTKPKFYTAKKDSEVVYEHAQTNCSQSTDCTWNMLNKSARNKLFY